MPETSGATLSLWLYAEAFNQTTASLKVMFDGTPLFTLDSTNQAAYKSYSQAHASGPDHGRPNVSPVTGSTARPNNNDRSSGSTSRSSTAR